MSLYPFKNEKGKHIHNEIFNNIPHFIKSCLHFNYLQDDFFMYNDKVLIIKRESITYIADSMIPLYFCQNNEPVFNFTTDDMRSKLEEFSKNRMDALYLTEIMRTKWLKMMDKYWDEIDTP